MVKLIMYKLRFVSHGSSIPCRNPKKESKVVATRCRKPFLYVANMVATTIKNCDQHLYSQHSRNCVNWFHESFDTCKQSGLKRIIKILRILMSSNNPLCIIHI